MAEQRAKSVKREVRGPVPGVSAAKRSLEGRRWGKEKSFTKGAQLNVRKRGRAGRGQESKKNIGESGNVWNTCEWGKKRQRPSTSAGRKGST